MSRIAPAAMRFALGALLLVASAGPAAACPVCYGGTEGAMMDGLRWSIVFLGALVYVLLGGGIALAFALRRRARRLADRLADPHRGLHLVAGGPAGGSGSRPPGGGPER